MGNQVISFHMTSTALFSASQQMLALHKSPHYWLLWGKRLAIRRAEVEKSSHYRKMLFTTTIISCWPIQPRCHSTILLMSRNNGYVHDVQVSNFYIRLQSTSMIDSSLLSNTHFHVCFQSGMQEGCRVMMFLPLREQPSQEAGRRSAA